MSNDHQTMKYLIEDAVRDTFEKERKDMENSVLVGANSSMSTRINSIGAIVGVLLLAGSIMGYLGISQHAKAVVKERFDDFFRAELVKELDGIKKDLKSESDKEIKKEVKAAIKDINTEVTKAKDALAKITEGVDKEIKSIAEEITQDRFYQIIVPNIESKINSLYSDVYAEKIEANATKNITEINDSIRKEYDDKMKKFQKSMSDSFEGNSNEIITNYLNDKITPLADKKVEELYTEIVQASIDGHMSSVAALISNLKDKTKSSSQSSSLFDKEKEQYSQVQKIKKCDGDIPVVIKSAGNPSGVQEVLKKASNNGEDPLFCTPMNKGGNYMVVKFEGGDKNLDYFKKYDKTAYCYNEYDKTAKFRALHDCDYNVDPNTITVVKKLSPPINFNTEISGVDSSNKPEIRIIASPNISNNKPEIRIID